MIVSGRPWRETCGFAEEGAEVVWVVHATAVGDFGDCKIGVKQQTFGLAYSELQDIVLCRQACNGFKFAIELGTSDAQF